MKVFNPFLHVTAQLESGNNTKENNQLGQPLIEYQLAVLHLQCAAKQEEES